MKLLPSASCLVLSVLFFAQIAGGTEFDRRNATVQAVAKTKEAIVTIKKTRANGEKEVAGTGIVVDERGLVVTNKHVVGNARTITVRLSDGTEMVGDVLMAEARYDLAVVRVKAGRKLHALRLAPTSDLMVGEEVIAIGHPYGYVNTVSRGIISALGREITLPTGDVLTGLIQTDASINPGNSGGPLLNVNGELIGINVALREGAQGIAFAINSGTVQKALSNHFSALKVSGILHGLKIEEKILAETGDRQRLIVSDETGELKRGDMILAVGTSEVANSFDLERALWGKKPGEVVAVKISRGGREVNASLTLAAGEGLGTVTSAAAVTVPMPAVTKNVPAANAD